MGVEALITVVTGCQGDDEWADHAVVLATAYLQDLEEEDYETLQRWVRVQPPPVRRRLADVLGDGPSIALPLLEYMLERCTEPEDVRAMADAIRHLARRDAACARSIGPVVLAALRDMRDGGDRYAGEIMDDLVTAAKAAND